MSLDMRVSWKRAAGIIAGLLLPLPLVLTLYAATSWTHWPAFSPGTDVSPILPPDERRQLQTFEKHCTQREDCEPPLGCLEIYTGGPRFCVASECQSDSQCEEGFTCQTRPTLDNGPRVRRCAVIGTRQEGQPCVSSADTREEACAQGLICNGVCGRPCVLEDPTSCPDGLACRNGSDGPSCRPHCKDRECPEGQECIHHDDELPMCAVLRGNNCQRTTCPEGRECQVRYQLGGQRPTVDMECVVPCGKDKSPCPDGLVCDFGACRQRCNPNGPDTCGPNNTCGYLPVEESWLCFPRYD